MSRPPNADNSITSFAEDKLDREDFARRVARRIELAESGPSVVFGLAGPWGSGKTSVLAMIRLALEQCVGWSVVEFTPWSAADVQTLTGEFYEAVAAAMPADDEEGRTARDLLMASVPTTAALAKIAVEGLIDSKFGDGVWQKMANAVVGRGASRLDKLPTSKPAPFRTQFEAVSDAVKKTGSKVLVIVDDLDRLHVDELMTVMKAVRLLGRFPGVHYLLSYDKRTIIDLLSAAQLVGGNADRANAYLEKIVQYPFELPPLQTVHSEREIREQIEQVAARHNCSTARTEQGFGRRVDLVDDLIALLPITDRATLRAIYRWSGQVDVLFALVGEQELDLADAALITYLRLHHAHVYDQLLAWRSDLVGPAPRLITLGAKHPTVDDWLARLMGPDIELSQPDASAVYRILAYLFPKLEHHIGTRYRADAETPRVHLDEYFDRYFMFTLPVGDISDVAAASDVRALLDTGALPPNGMLRRSLSNGTGTTKRLALSKLHREIDKAVESSTSADLLLAALSDLKLSLLNDHGHLPWLSDRSRIAVMLFHQALSVSADPLRTVNRLRCLFDLYGTAAILSHLRAGQDEYTSEVAAAIRDV